jgi:hypothetical protein
MTELIWDGKYDKDGRRVAPPPIALPFQTVETVNESAQERQRVLDLFGSGRDPEWRNRLIWGDKKYVLPAQQPEFAGKVDMVSTACTTWLRRRGAKTSTSPTRTAWPRSGARTRRC